MVGFSPSAGRREQLCRCENGGRRVFADSVFFSSLRFLWLQVDLSHIGHQETALQLQSVTSAASVEAYSGGCCHVANHMYWVASGCVWLLFFARVWGTAPGRQRASAECDGLFDQSLAVPLPRFLGCWLYNEGKLCTKLQQANFGSCTLRRYRKTMASAFGPDTGLLGKVSRRSWVQSTRGRACCAKGDGLRLRPSQLL